MDPARALYLALGTAMATIKKDPALHPFDKSLAGVAIPYLILVVSSNLPESLAQRKPALPVQNMDGISHSRRF